MRPSNEHIAAVIQEHGSIRKAAPFLGHDERTIRRWLKADGVEVPSIKVKPVQPDGPTREEILQAEVKELRQRSNKHRSIDVQAERVLEQIAATMRPAEPVYVAPAPSSVGAKSHVQALVLSDLHCGEVVDS